VQGVLAIRISSNISTADITNRKGKHAECRDLHIKPNISKEQRECSVHALQDHEHAHMSGGPQRPSIERNGATSQSRRCSHVYQITSIERTRQHRKRGTTSRLRAPPPPDLQSAHPDVSYVASAWCLPWGRLCVTLIEPDGRRTPYSRVGRGSPTSSSPPRSSFSYLVLFFLP
jgi:hypothetical protein